MSQEQMTSPEPWTWRPGFNTLTDADGRVIVRFMQTIGSEEHRANMIRILEALAATRTQEPPMTA